MNSANRQHIRDWFAVGCGLFGIWEVLRAADSLMFAFDLINGWYSPSRPTGYTVAGEVLYAIGHFFLGLALLASATKLAAFWYPDTANDKGSNEDDSDSNTTKI
jgi:hypothetical protein